MGINSCLNAIEIWSEEAHRQAISIEVRVLSMLDGLIILILLSTRENGVDQNKQKCLNCMRYTEINGGLSHKDFPEGNFSLIQE